MSRQHLFRAYSKEYGWADPKQINVRGDGTVYIDFDYQKGDDSEVFLMEWTGRHDCDGAEIWEGDVVDWDGDIAEVEYADEKACFILMGLGDCCDWAKMCWATESENKVKVIGNIHDNPELLENES